MSIDKMNEAIRCAETFDISKSPYGVPAYPWVWNYNKEHKSIRLEMGVTEGAEVGTVFPPRRAIAMFMLQIVPTPTPVHLTPVHLTPTPVLVHVAVWLTDPNADPRSEGWKAMFTRNTNWHLASILHFKGTLLNTPGGAYAVITPLPPPPSS